MRVNGHLTGMRGVYLVAAELSRLGFIASPTSRSAMGADILATDQKCQKAYSVQVKTNAKSASFWLVGAKAREISSETHIYVLVNICVKKETEVVEYYIVPSAVVANKMISAISRTEAKTEWHQVNKIDVAHFMGDWSAFGSAV
jgi:hypothetical protein